MSKNRFFLIFLSKISLNFLLEKNFFESKKKPLIIRGQSDLWIKENSKLFLTEHGEANTFVPFVLMNAIRLVPSLS